VWLAGLAPPATAVAVRTAASPLPEIAMPDAASIDPGLRRRCPGGDTDQTALLGGQPELDRLIRLRMPCVEPLNPVQIELIRRRRTGDDDPRVREGILLAINGIAAGLRNGR